VPQRRSRVERTEANRAAVLSAAQRVFSERGYVAATLDQIAEEAGFSKGVVYSQFQSKADLFLHVLQQRIVDRADENQAAVDAADRGDSFSVDDAVRELNRRMSRSDPEWRLAVMEFRIAAARDPELHARYAAAHRSTVARLAAVFDQLYARAGVAAPVDTRHVAATVLALDVGVVLEDASSSSSIPDEALEVLVRRLVFGS
jgi:AcrR family transcriptional regulator